VASFPRRRVRDQPSFDYLLRKAFRVSIPRQKTPLRCRGLDQIRQLSAEVGLIPRSPRTLSSSAANAGRGARSPSAPQKRLSNFDGYTGGETIKRFILHYNFPPFSWLKPDAPAPRSPAKSVMRCRLALLAVIPEREISLTRPREQRGHGIPWFASMAAFCSGILALRTRVQSRGRSPAFPRTPSLEFTQTAASIATQLTYHRQRRSTSAIGFKLWRPDMRITGFQLDL